MKRRLYVTAVLLAVAAGIVGLAAQAGADDGPGRRPPIEDVRPR